MIMTFKFKAHRNNVQGANDISPEFYDIFCHTVECTPTIYGIPKIRKKEALLSFQFSEFSAVWVVSWISQENVYLE